MPESRFEGMSSQTKSEQYLPFDVIQRSAKDNFPISQTSIQEGEPQSKLSNAVNAFLKSGGQYFTNAIESAGIATSLDAAQQMNKQGNFVKDQDLFKAIENNPIRQFGSKGTEYLEENLPTTKDGFLENTLPSAGGYLISGMITSLIPGGAMNTAMSAALSQAGAEFNQALSKTKDYNKALEVMTYNLPIGATEAIPISNMFKRINKLTNNAFGKTLGKYLSENVQNGLVQAFEEGSQEIFQSVASNLTAQQLYDETRKLTDGALEGGAAGGVLGFSLTMLMGAIGLKKRGGNPKEVEILNKAEEEVKKLYDKQRFVENTKNQADKIYKEDFNQDVFKDVRQEIKLPEDSKNTEQILAAENKKTTKKTLSVEQEAKIKELKGQLRGSTKERKAEIRAEIKAIREGTGQSVVKENLTSENIQPKPEANANIQPEAKPNEVKNEKKPEATNLNTPVKAFIDNKVKELGSIEAVEKEYSYNDKVSKYAKEQARKMFGEPSEVSNVVKGQPSNNDQISKPQTEAKSEQPRVEQKPSNEAVSEEEKQKILNSPFKHHSWTVNGKKTKKEALNELAKNPDVWLDKKLSKNQTDNLLDDMKYDDVLKDERNTYRLSPIEKEYYLERKNYWQKEKRKETVRFADENKITLKRKGFKEGYLEYIKLPYQLRKEVWEKDTKGIDEATKKTKGLDFTNIEKAQEEFQNKYGYYPFSLDHRENIKYALQNNKQVSIEVLNDYKGEKWADEAIAKMEGSSKNEIGSDSQLDNNTPAIKNMLERGKGIRDISTALNVSVREVKKVQNEYRKEKTDKLGYNGLKDLTETELKDFVDNKGILDEIFTQREIRKNSKASEKRQATTEILKLLRKVPQLGLKFDKEKNRMLKNGVSIYPVQRSEKVSIDDVNIKNEKAKQPFEKLGEEERYKQQSLSELVKPEDLPNGIGKKTLEKGVNDIIKDSGKEQSKEAQLVREAALKIEKEGYRPNAKFESEFIDVNNIDAVEEQKKRAKELQYKNTPIGKFEDLEEQYSSALQNLDELEQGFSSDKDLQNAKKKLEDIESKIEDLKKEYPELKDFMSEDEKKRINEKYSFNLSEPPKQKVKKKNNDPTFGKEFNKAEFINKGKDSNKIDKGLEGTDLAEQKQEDKNQGKLFQKVTDNPNFKKWFGDSKVVDENGEPLVVYHGTNKEFDVFKSTKFPTAGYFAEDIIYAKSFARTITEYRGGKENVKAVYLKIEKPFDASQYPGDKEYRTLVKYYSIISISLNNINNFISPHPSP
jgi:hypothetical protein